MKTRLLIVIGLSIAAIFGGLYTANVIKNIEDQTKQEEWRELRADLLSKIKKDNISDPICLVMDRSSSDNIGSEVTMDTCISLKQFEEMGCTKPMLEHLAQYSNLLDYESDGTWYMKFIGLPSGMSVKDFNKCVDVIKELRQILEPKPEPEPQQIPIPEDADHNTADTYVHSIPDAKSIVDFELSIPSYLPKGYALDNIKIDKQRTHASITYLPEDFTMEISPYTADGYYAQYGALVIIHRPMGKNFNMTYYLEDIPGIENKKIYDLNGTYAEGIDYDDQTLSSIKIFRNDRMKVDVWWNGTTNELLSIVESMNLGVPHVPYTPDPDYVSGAPEPIPQHEPTLEPENEN